MVGWVEAELAALGVGGEEEVRLVPIPAHGGVLAGRGYHPASMLCGELEGAWARRRRSAGYPLGRVVMWDGVLWRTRRSAPQASMGDAGARARNVAGSFGVRGEVSGLVVVFDDVVTTGSTVGEAARVLKEAGAARVVVWAAARV
jgi:predicted amidophosphoribosyltransferase